MKVAGEKLFFIVVTTDKANYISYKANYIIKL